MKIGDTEIFPTKIICLGRNYLDHIKESGNKIPKEPVLFAKTINCLIKDKEPIIYPKKLYFKHSLNRIDHEVELAVIIKKKCKNIIKRDSTKYILGYTIFNDITARKLQLKAIRSHHPWYIAKSLDTFAPIGPCIVPHNKIGDPYNLKIELKVNGEIKQSSNTKHLLFKIPELLEYISSYLTLEQGDIIATGTPGGVGPLLPGDIVKATIEKIGTLTNLVKLEEN